MSPDRLLIFPSAEIIDQIGPSAQEVKRVLVLAGKNPGIVDHLIDFAERSGRRLFFGRVWANHPALRSGFGFECNLSYDREPGEPIAGTLALSYQRSRQEDAWRVYVGNENTSVGLHDPVSFDLTPDGDFLIKQNGGPIIAIRRSLWVDLLPPEADLNGPPADASWSASFRKPPYTPPILPASMFEKEK